MSSLITWEVARGRAEELRLLQRAQSHCRELLSDPRVRRPRRGRFRRSRSAPR